MIYMISPLNRKELMSKTCLYTLF